MYKQSSCLREIPKQGDVLVFSIHETITDRCYMKTPICTRLKELSEQGTIRFHMPGHKQKDTGMCFLKDFPKMP